MCGIFCSICLLKNTSPNEDKFNVLKSKLKNRGPDASSSCKIILFDEYEAFFAGHVLWTQGDSIVNQPIRGSDKVFLWNGDVYSGLQQLDRKVCDTLLLFESMNESVTETLCQICGPYAFIFWDGSSLSFGRDPLGRQSLLWKIEDDCLILTSVGSSSIDYNEVPAFGIFSINLKKGFDVSLKSWSHLNLKEDYVKNVEVSLTESINHSILSKIVLREFNEPSEPDLNFLLDVRGKKDPGVIFTSLLTNEKWIYLVKKLLVLLEESISLRVTTLPPYCQLCLLDQRKCEHAKLAVLFSGGLDSTLIALLSDKYVPEDETIDLYNVAFEREKGKGFNVPDRLTGLKSLEELKKLAPKRKWNFIEININQEELIEKRCFCISDLIYPLNSVLDESLGCALWFAARGRGTVKNEPYNSTARVVLLGMGADELMGGYRKARRAFKEGSWSMLNLELWQGVKDIPSRNLGRDNRVVSDHSVVPRMPYLHEPLVLFLCNLPPWQRCYLGDELPQGIGDKLILRLAAWSVGLKEAAAFPKRALQFGSRIANPKEQGHLPSDRLKSLKV